MSFGEVERGFLPSVGCWFNFQIVNSLIINLHTLLRYPTLGWTEKFWFNSPYYWCDWHTIVTLKSKNEPIWTNFIVGKMGFSIFGLFLGWILTLSWSQGSGRVNFCSNMTCYTILEMAEPQQDSCVDFETISQR